MDKCHSPELLLVGANLINPKIEHFCFRVELVAWKFSGKERTELCSYKVEQGAQVQGHFILPQSLQHPQMQPVLPRHEGASLFRVVGVSGNTEFRAWGLVDLSPKELPQWKVINCHLSLTGSYRVSAFQRGKQV